MSQEDRWAHLVNLDEELLQGGVVLSEWCSLIVRETDTAFVNKAHLATILTAVSGIETYFRSEYAFAGKLGLAELINQAHIDDDLRNDLHSLRRYRNKWVHVEEPWDDEQLLVSTENIEIELERMAYFAVRSLRRAIYSFPWV